MRHLVSAAGADDRFELESAGTGSWHIGNLPDPRTRAEAERRGVAMTSRARQFAPEDFARLDLVLAMDHQNAHDLRALAQSEADRAKVRLLREFDPTLAADADRAVPDPYYGGPEGFGEVFEMVERACAGLLAELEGDRPPQD